MMIEGPSRRKVMGDRGDGQCVECGLKKNAHTADCIRGALELTRGLVPDALIADVLATYADQQDPIVLKIARLLRDRRNAGPTREH
jgi:hypothetical protein